MTRNVEISSSRDSEKEPKKELEGQYQVLLGRYKSCFDEIQKIKRRQPGAHDIPESHAAIAVIDDERHDIHQSLIGIGQRLGKSEAVVLRDILVQRKDLGEYGLPEFHVLTHNTIGRNKVLLVFDEVATPKVSRDYTRRDFSNSIDMRMRRERAEVLAKELEFSFFESGIYTDEVVLDEYHDWVIHAFGVVMPAKYLEKVLDIIKNNPKKFRLGYEFYSDEDKEEL